MLRFDKVHDGNLDKFAKEYDKFKRKDMQILNTNTHSVNSSNINSGVNNSNNNGKNLY